MVDREITLTYAELVDRQFTEAWITLNCVSNPVGGDLIGNAWWSGVRLADMLAQAGPQAGADAVLQTSDDGWTCGTPLAALTDGRNAMLAVAMNGTPLPIEHGFPVRTWCRGSTATCRRASGSWTWRSRASTRSRRTGPSGAGASRGRSRSRHGWTCRGRVRRWRPAR